MSTIWRPSGRGPSDSAPSSAGLESALLDPGNLRDAVTFDRAADWKVAAGVVAAALGTDLAVRSGVAGVAGVALVAVVVAGLLATGRVTNPQAWGVLGSTVLFAPWLAWRSSPWLLPFDILACGLLLVAGASLARGGSLLDITIPAAALRALHAVFHGLTAPVFLLGRRTSRAAERANRSPAVAYGVLRGVGLALPVVVVLGLLMGSADVVFAGLFRFWSPGEGLLHAVLWVVGAWGAAGLARLASAGPCPTPPRSPVRIGTIEVTVVLAALVALFSAFCAAQVVAFSGGGRHVIETAGLTYAEYARTGFFQLLAVAAITVGVLLGLRSLVDTEEPRVRWLFAVLGEACVALTLFVVIVALRRLALYEDAFGLTMLRLYSQAFAVWIAVAVVMLGVLLAGVGARRAWYPTAAVVAGLSVLLALNFANPEAVVVRRNVDHASTGGRFDPGYLADLSDDAVPALVASLPALDPPDRAVVRQLLCPPPGSPESGGWAAANRSRQRAAAARSQVCAEPPR